MSKNNKPVSAAQLERRQATQLRRQRRERFWTIFIVALGIGLIGLFVAVQISHHL
jgi:hypothetical protein